MTKEQIKEAALAFYTGFLALEGDWCKAHNLTLRYFKDNPPYFVDGFKPISDAINSPEGIKITRKFVPPTRWEVHSLDVWGNTEDGFDVNNEFKSGSVEIPFNASDDELLQIFKDSYCLKESVTLEDVEFDEQSSDGFFAIIDSDTGEPVYHVYRNEE